MLLLPHCCLVLTLLGGFSEPHRTVAAPDGPDSTFLGTWVLDIAASDFGRSPAPDSAVTIIVRADERLVMSRTFFSASQQSRLVEIDIAVDGTVQQTGSVSEPQIPAKAEWSSAALVLTLFGQSNVGEIEVIDVMTVDGDMMRVERSVVIPVMPGLTQSFVLRRR